MEENFERFEPYKPKRNPDGTFITSGNPNGRPKKVKPVHSIPQYNHKTAFEIAEMIVPVTVNGRQEEMSAYRASMLALAQKAMSGDLRAIKMFRGEIDAAAAGNVHHLGLVQDLLAMLDDQQKQLDMVGKFFPKFADSGVVQIDQDGNVVPNSWMASIRKLNDIEARERALEQREKLLEIREAMINPGPVQQARTAETPED